MAAGNRRASGGQGLPYVTLHRSTQNFCIAARKISAVRHRFLQHPCSGKAQTPVVEKLRPHRGKSSDPTEGKAQRNFAVRSAARISRFKFFGKDSLACFVMYDLKGKRLVYCGLESKK